MHLFLSWEAMNGEAFFGSKVDEARKLAVPFQHKEEKLNALNKLRKQVLGLFGLCEVKDLDKFWGVSEYDPQRGIVEKIVVFEFLDEDGLGYVFHYEIAEGRVRFLDLKLLVPSWWWE